MNINLNRRSNSRQETRLLKVLSEKQKTGEFRTTRFFYDGFKKKRFANINYEAMTAEDFASQIDSIISVLNDKFGDKWDFTLMPLIEEVYNEETSDYDNIYKGLSITVLLHYPHINISNSRGATAIIQDLIVTFFIKSNENGTGDQLTVSKLLGTRASLDYKEWFSYYLHSHLNTMKPTTYDDCFTTKEFCLGSGGITELLADMWDSEYKYDPIIFEAFLYAIDSLVEWESIEGTPYIEFEKNVASTDTEKQLSDTLSKSALSDYFNTFRQTIISDLDNVDFILSENRYKIKDNLKFREYLKKNLKTNRYLLQNLLYVKRGNKLIGYRSIGPSVTEEVMSERFKQRGELPSIFIQGNELKFKVRGHEGTEEENLTGYKVHPNFINYAKEQLEQQLFIKYIRKSTIDKQNQVSNA